MNPISVVKEKQYFPWANTLLAEKILWECVDWKSCLLSENIEASLRGELDKVAQKTWAIRHEGKFLLRVCGKIIYAGNDVNMPVYVKESIDNFFELKEDQ